MLESTGMSEPWQLDPDNATSIEMFIARSGVGFLTKEGAWRRLSNRGTSPPTLHPRAVM